MKIKFYYFSIIILASLTLVFSAFRFADDVSCKSEKNKSIIKFSHKAHSGTVECEACHVKIQESTSLKDGLLPNKETCTQCHDVQDDKECGKCHYDGVNEKLVQSKSSLIFNHKFHLTEEKINCSECHIGLFDANYSFEAKQPFPKMNNCSKCHNEDEEEAPNTCSLCHISTANLLPQNHKVSNFSKTHKFLAETKLSECRMCHNDVFCQSCHTGTTKVTEKNYKDDFYLPFESESYTDNVKQQKITRVHDLNYQYSHGIDAKGKSSNCETCHSTETFCGNCHNAFITTTGVAPSSHTAANFVTIGVGTGGGEHAKLAKRDISTCSSCHDYDGGDPTCTMCHTDYDGIKGTNPKTHKTGYMKDVKGDWHDNNGSMCYVCHTSGLSNKIYGLGFCGYCHVSK